MGNPNKVLTVRTVLQVFVFVVLRSFSSASHFMELALVGSLGLCHGRHSWLCFQPLSGCPPPS